MKAIWHDNRVLSAIRVTSEMAVKDAVEMLTDYAKKSMPDPGTHNPYRSRKGDGSIHLSSKPGEPPAVDTGELRASVSWAISNGDKSDVGPEYSGEAVETPNGILNDVVGRVGSSYDIAAILELYADDEPGEAIRRREWLRPTSENNHAKIKKIIMGHF